SLEVFAEDTIPAPAELFDEHTTPMTRGASISSRRRGSIFNPPQCTLGWVSNRPKRTFAGLLAVPFRTMLIVYPESYY
ncbi:MAG: hypothetical protein ACXABV_18065, partial [Candidatus Thorarchaeota archaeon]